MSDFMQALGNVVDEHTRLLCHIRKVSRLEALEQMAETYKRDLHDSLGTSMESYFRAALEIVDRRIAAESGFSAVGADRRWQ